MCVYMSLLCVEVALANLVKRNTKLKLKGCALVPFPEP